MGSAVGTRRNPLGIAAAVMAAAVDVGYLILIGSEGGGNDLARVLLVAATLGGAALAGWVGSSSANYRIKASALGAAAGTLMSLGYLALFSIGLVLIVAGILALVAASAEALRSGRGVAALLGFLVGVAVVLVPFLFSS